MEIRKKDENRTHHKVAIFTGSFLLVIIGVTLLGMSVFSPQSNQTHLRNKAPLIGSPIAQASENDLLPDLDQHLDNLADTLENVVEDARDTNTIEDGDSTAADDDSKQDAQELDNNLDTAVEAGKATWNLWSLLWDVIWPRVNTVVGNVWSVVTSE